MTDKLFDLGLNAWPTLDIISSACNPALLKETRPEGCIQDKHYGRAWSFQPEPGDALYGRTNDIPDGPSDRYALMGFLRTPYKRIPRIPIRSKQDFYSIVQKAQQSTKQVKLLLRGQDREHFLERSPSAKEILYGDASVKEPSLLPSASRYSTDLAKFLPGWSMILESYVRNETKRSGDRRERENIILDAANLMSGYSFRRFAYALAQHYGLPSVGLDLTDDAEVALFFALHSYKRYDAVAAALNVGAASYQRVGKDAQPVVYMLGTRDLHTLDDSRAFPSWVRAARPTRQNAFFFSAGWGASPNRAAEYIVAALYLQDHENWDLRLTPRDLFPSSHEDRFLDHVFKTWREHEFIQDYVPLKNIYVVT